MPAELFANVGWTLVKVVAFVGVMLFVGPRVLPWILVRIAHTRSRELFTLGVLAIALGLAWIAYALFHSFALGAFLAGLVLNSSPLGHNAAERSLPLRDAFAVLFFVSVGMLFDPAILVNRPWAVVGVLAIVIVGKTLAALAITTAFKLDRKTSLTVGASLAQIGEFSFILAALGVSLGAIRQETHDLILAAALLFWCVARGFGSRRPGFDVILALFMSSAAYLAFDVGLGLNLPSGILGGGF